MKTLLILAFTALTFTAFAQDSVLTGEMVVANTMAVRNMRRQPAPAFSAFTLDGKKKYITGLRGKVVVLSVWTTSCGPCIREINSFKNIKKRYKDKQVEFIALSPVDNLADIKTFLTKHTLDFGIWYQPSANFVKDYTAVAYPTNYVIDKTGIVRYASPGYSKTNYSDISAVVKQYL